MSPHRPSKEEDRYRVCAERIWRLFPLDPLPEDCPAQGWVERLEALLDRNLLQPRRPPRLRGVPCPKCDGHGYFDNADGHGLDARCPHCGGTGEIA
jgi:hypothetical protein